MEVLNQIYSCHIYPSPEVQNLVWKHSCRVGVALFWVFGGFLLSLTRITLNLPYFSVFKSRRGEKILLDGTSMYSESHPSTGKMSYTDITCLVSKRGVTVYNRMI